MMLYYCTVIYIPLCFYFIEMYGVTDNAVRKIYIPLCFYFIDNHLHHLTWDFWIYIPLCFYFIAEGPWMTKTEESYLHSTMLLLYRWRVSSVSSPFQFTFHYASTLSWHTYRIASCFFIYIPLCFYFIKFKLSTSFDCIFHLHSTMLLLYRIRSIYPGYSYIFTFHYASTLSPQVLICKDQLLIYIPLCFYFIYFRSSITRSHSNLHSTMLLLYRGCRRSLQGLRLHFHSTLLRIYRLC